MESNTFTNVIRVQLNTTSSKPCTYIADYNNERVFVKGPFKTLEDASIALSVIKAKNTIFQDLITTPITVIPLTVDVGFDCQLGLRIKMMGKIGYFQIHKCYITEDPVPTIKKWSEKAWKVPVNVVDFSKIKSVSHFKYDKHGIYYKSWSKSMDDFVMNAIVSWIIGSGADLAGRNFLMVRDRCVQVDMDSIKRYDWDLCDTYVASSRTNANEQMKSYVIKHWDRYFRDAFARIVEVPEFSRTSTVLLDKLFVSKKRKMTQSTIFDTCKRHKTGIVRGKSTSTFRHAVDTWGHLITLRKSDFQKAIRRGNINQALVAFFACYNIESLFPSDPSAKSIQTNIINRLVICAMEDIGVANTSLVTSIVKVIVPMVKKRGLRNKHTLAKYVILLCNSKKTRVQSHMSHYYAKVNNVAFDIDATIDNPQCFSVCTVGNGELVWDKVGNQMHDIKQYWITVAKRNKRAIAQYALSVAFFGIGGNKEQKDAIMHYEPVSLPSIDDIVISIMHNEIDMEPLPEANDMHVNGGHTYDAKRHFRSIVHY